MLNAVAERLPADRLNSVKQQVAAVQNRYRQQVQEADVRGYEGNPANKCNNPEFCNLSGNLRQHNRTTHLFGRLAMGNDITDAGNGLGDVGVCLLGSPRDGFKGADREGHDLIGRRRALNADEPTPECPAKKITLFIGGWDRLKRDRLTVAADRENQFVTRVRRHNPS